VECRILFHNVILQVDVEDQWLRPLDPVVGYSVRCEYCFMCSSDQQINTYASKLLWRK
jgi:hypothetical protein